MARFFFHIHDSDITVDEEGIDCVDASAARDRAIREARILACETIRYQGTLFLGDRIEIFDEENREVAKVRFGDAVAIVE